MPTSGVCPSCRKAGWLRRKVSVTSTFAEREYECSNCWYSWKEAIARNAPETSPGAGVSESRERPKRKP